MAKGSFFLKPEPRANGFRLPLDFQCGRKLISETVRHNDGRFQAVLMLQQIDG